MGGISVASLVEFDAHNWTTKRPRSLSRTRGVVLELPLRFDNGIPQGTFVFFRLLLMESPRVCYSVWMWCGNNNPQITPTNHRETVPAAHDCPVVAHLRYCIFLMSASWSLSTIQTSERKCHRSCLVQLREMVVPTPLLQR